MNEIHRPSPYTLVYLLAFGLALCLRLLNLGAAPLSDTEAEWALEALRLARPALETSGSFAQPAYIALTGLSFILFGATDFLARFWPALIGSMLVPAAWLLRRDLGRAAAVILAVGLALDPGLVTVSRQAGGMILAPVFCLLAYGLWRNQHPIAAGIMGGLALLSGPSLWIGLPPLLAAFWLTRLIRIRTPSIRIPDSTSDDPKPLDAVDPFSATGPQASWVQAGIAGLITFLIVGTGFFIQPGLLAGFLGSLTTYIQGWMNSSGVHLLTVLAALVVYAPLVVIISLMHSIRIWLGQFDLPFHRPISIFNLFWAGSVMLTVLINPSRQVSDLIWGIIPLWMLTASELAHHNPRKNPHLMTYLQGALVIFLGAFFRLILIGLDPSLTPNLSWIIIQSIVLIGIIVLGVLTSTLVALGWSWEISRNGTIWGLVVLLMVYSIGMQWGAAQLRPNQPEELWGGLTGPGQTHLMSATLDDLSNWDRGMINMIEVVSTVDTASICWTLRDYPNARYQEQIAAGEQPTILITQAGEQAPELSEAYRGQDFVWWIRPGWEGPLPADFKNWWAFRRAPLNKEHIILWVRNDVFPGAAGSNSE